VKLFEPGSNTGHLKNFNYDIFMMANTSIMYKQATISNFRGVFRSAIFYQLMDLFDETELLEDVPMLSEYFNDDVQRANFVNFCNVCVLKNVLKCQLGRHSVESIIQKFGSGGRVYDKLMAILPQGWQNAFSLDYIIKYVSFNNSINKQDPILKHCANLLTNWQHYGVNYTNEQLQQLYNLFSSL